MELLNGEIMVYYKIETDYSPLITGKRNGGCAVEIKDKSSFYSDVDKKFGQISTQRI